MSPGGLDGVPKPFVWLEVALAERTSGALRTLAVLFQWYSWPQPGAEDADAPGVGVQRLVGGHGPARRERALGAGREGLVVPRLLERLRAGRVVDLGVDQAIAGRRRRDGHGE